MLYINYNFIFEAIDRAFVRLVYHFEQEQISQLESEKWAWYRETIRSSGEIAGTIRNIIDQGNLRDSLEVYIIGNEASFFYDIDYASLVHEGGTTSTGNSYLARPWVTEAIDSAKLFNTFIIFLKQELRL